MTLTTVAVKPAWYARPYVRAAGIYLLVRWCGLVILSLLSDHHNRSLLDLLHAWDGEWYLFIADHGYGTVPGNLVDAAGNHSTVTSLAFFPAYPLLMRALTAITGTGLVVTGLFLSAVAGVLAACAIFRIGRQIDGRPQVGLLLVALWAGAPMAITLSMTYTEALFTALAAWTLVGVLERRWLLAGLCCAGAGLVRPTASVLVAVVGVAAVMTWLRTEKHRWPPLACAVLCPAGLVGYWAYVANRTGSLTGWFDIERRGWDFQFDGGRETWTFTLDTLGSGSSVMETMNVFIVLAAVVLALLGFLQRVPWPLAAYAAGVVIMVIGSSGIAFAKARFLLPGFTLLIPVAIGLANRRPRTTLAVTAGFILFGCWFSAYTLTGWRYAI